MTYSKGIHPPSKARIKRNRPQWMGESEKQKALQIRRDNPTYGKAKIVIILKRDLGVSLSESTVGRILSLLMEEGLITRSASAVRSRKKRNFIKGHAKPWSYKE